MTWDPTTLAFIADGIAFLALTVSGLSLFYSRFDKRPRLRVSLETEEVTPEPDPEWGPEPSVEIFFFEVSNRGETRIRVRSVALAWGDSILRYPRLEGDPKMKEPFWLHPGDSVYFTGETDDLIDWLHSQGARRIVVLRGIAWDGLGKRHQSRAICLEIPEPRGPVARSAEEN